jgi:hypothetical protein
LAALADRPGPAAGTGRLWLLRLGLYRLQRPVETAGDWCWLVDHTALLGRQRLLVVLGARLGPFAERAARGDGALRLADVRLLHLAAVEDPDGQRLQRQLGRLAERAGVPRAIVSGRGADLLAGIRLFRRGHPEVAEVCDFKHFAANRLKALLQSRPGWAEFQTGLGRTRAALQQTEWAFVVPPALRTKSRYLNLDVLLRWAEKARALLALPRQQLAARGEVARLEKALGWLRGLDEELAAWGEWLALTEEAASALRQGGLHPQAARQLSGRLKRLRRGEQGRQLSRALVGFVAEQQTQAKAGERLIASTEVLESLFGRFKALTKEHSRGGVTALALAMGGLLGGATEQEVEQALRACSTKDARDWVADNLAPNVQQQRRWLCSLVPGRKKNHATAARAAA